MAKGQPSRSASDVRTPEKGERGRQLRTPEKDRQKDVEYQEPSAKAEGPGIAAEERDRTLNMKKDLHSRAKNVHLKWRPAIEHQENEMGPYERNLEQENQVKYPDRKERAKVEPSEECWRSSKMKWTRNSTAEQK
jgi:hypothetical protein